MVFGANAVFRLVLAPVGVLVFGLVDLLVVGLMFGLVLGLISFVTSPSIARQASSPVQSQRGDRRLSLLVASMLALAYGLISGLGLVQRLVQRYGPGVWQVDGSVPDAPGGRPVPG
jgi:hypothetical protein